MTEIHGDIQNMKCDYALISLAKPLATTFDRVTPRILDRANIYATRVIIIFQHLGVRTFNTRFEGCPSQAVLLPFRTLIIVT